VSKLEKHYGDGETIFQEGESSNSAFVIRDGVVALYKEGERGRVLLARLSPGEILGEMGILDGGVRSATAIAVGAVTVEVFARNDFLAQLQSNPDMALKVMGKLASRLRAADAMLVAQRGESGSNLPVPYTGGAEKGRGAEAQEPGFFGRLFGGRKREPSGKAGGTRPAGSPLGLPSILLVPQPGHAVYAQELGERLASFGFAARVAERPGGMVQLPEIRRWLAAESADLMIGVAGEEGMVEFRFLATQVIEDRPGMFFPDQRLILPVEIDEPWPHLLGAMALAAVDPRGEAQARLFQTHLMGVLEAAGDSARQPPHGLYDSLAVGLALIGLGNLFAQLGVIDPQGGWHREALELYRAAAERLPFDAPYEHGVAARLQGLSAQVLGERGGDLALLREAEKAYREALSEFTRERYPRDWGLLQNRLGVVLFRQDRLSADHEVVKAAMGAFQASLSQLTRSDDPYRWAEVLHNLAQAMQIYGAHQGNAEVLAKAADACRTVQEVWTYENAPLYWAAANNTLGTAQFLLAKRTGRADHARRAGEAFQAALMVYEGQNLKKLAAQARKNLSHCQNFHPPRQPPPMDDAAWAQSQKGDESP